MTPGEERAVRLVIRGNVQGVGFRAWMAGEARGLGLSGWVRNRRDGTVEAVIAGPAEAVEELLEDCADGPPFATVERVEQHPAKAADAGTGGFEQRETV